MGEVLSNYENIQAFIYKLVRTKSSRSRMHASVSEMDDDRRKGVAVGWRYFPEYTERLLESFGIASDSTPLDALFSRSSRAAYPTSYQGAHDAAGLT